MKMIEKIKKFLEQEKIRPLWQFVKFGIVGVSNVIVSYLLYVGFLFLLRDLHWEKDYLAANIISFTLSIFWSFYWNNKYVFKEEETGKRNKWKALGKCFLSYGYTGYIQDNLLLYLWVEVFHISRLAAPVLNLFFSVPINFLLNKLWAFRDGSRK